MTEEDRQILLGALTTLGCALTDHSHIWTDGERNIYEQAIKILGVDPGPDLRPLLSDLDE